MFLDALNVPCPAVQSGLPTPQPSGMMVIYKLPSRKNNSADHITEEIWGPYGQRLGIFHEGLHLSSRLVHVKFPNNCFRNGGQCFPRQVFRLFQMPALNHPLLEMLKVQLWIIGHIPDQVISIPSFHPALPFPAKHSVHVGGEMENSNSLRPVSNGTASTPCQVLQS
jgi:hypothetical protein